MNLFKRLYFPTLKRRQLLSLLCLIGIALGVSLMLGFDLATNSALNNFKRVVSGVHGTATHQIVAGPGGIPDSVMKTVVTTSGVKSASPVIEWLARSPQIGNRTLQIRGLDLLVKNDLQQTFFAKRDSDFVDHMYDFITTPGGVLLSDRILSTYHIGLGDTIHILVNGRKKNLIVFDSFPNNAFGAGGDYFAIMDIASAQVITDQTGILSSIDLTLAKDDQTVERLKARLPSGFQIRKPRDRIHKVSQLVHSYRMNLQVMSLLAVFVGMFLIYNTMMFSVLQRRNQIGILRGLGATRVQIRINILLESIILGVLGSAIGLVIGTFLTRFLVNSVQTTVTDYYTFIHLGEMVITWPPYIKALLLGLLTTILSAAIPAWEASLFTPHALQVRSTLESRLHRSIKLMSVLGCAVLCIAFLLTRWPTLSPLPAYVAMFVLLFGFALLMPVFARFFIRLAETPIKALLGVKGIIAGRNILANLSRTSVALAALTVSLAITLGISIMIYSFRTSLQDWIGKSMQSDFYISSRLHEGARFDSTLPPGILDRLKTMDGIDCVNPYTESELSYRGRPILLQATDPSIQLSHGHFIFESGKALRHWKRLQAGDVLISESFANRFSVTEEDTICLNTRKGMKSFTVAAVFRSYTSDWGQVMMSHEQLQRNWNENRINALYLFIQPGADKAAFENRLRQALSEYVLTIYDYSELRKRVVGVFDRTVSISSVLQILAMIVSFIGIFSALMALVVERNRELALLRSMGMTRAQLRELLWVESGLLGLMASLASIPIGWILSMVLIDVINVRTFGWTIDYAIPWNNFVKIIFLAVIAAVASAVYPVLRLERLPIASALRGE